MIPRPEYPRPQYQRDEWLNLNGLWEFAEDPGDSGEQRGLTNAPLPEHIQAPFCRESALSGLGRTDRVAAVWYSREIAIPPIWTGRRWLLHFGAADYETTVWVDGRLAGQHTGGHTSFTVEVTCFLTAGRPGRLTIRCRDPWWTAQPRGKQAASYAHQGCHYPRTTGLWQTVWLEPVPTAFLKRPRLTPCLSSSAFLLEQGLDGPCQGHNVEVRLLAEGSVVARKTVPAGLDFTIHLELTIPEAARRLWTLEDPFLYELQISLTDPIGLEVDRVRSYGGLRSVALDGQRFLLNGQPVFQRLVLDQGYYPDGLLTAPSDEALENDIRLSKAAGFNGARLHQKIFEERFFYHADRLGYLVWGEFPDWGTGFGTRDFDKHFNASWIAEWVESIQRDYSHPSLIGWCPLNEQMPPGQEYAIELGHVMRAMFLAAKAHDRTRPVIDVSGWVHLVPETDLYDTHNYDQDPAQFGAKYRTLAETGHIDLDWPAQRPPHVPYRGQPFFVSEFGGIWWNPNARPGENSWGYGSRPATGEEFLKRFEGLCHALLDNPSVCAYCYTQLTDVFQEQNGLYTILRQPKFPLDRLRDIQTRPAAIERSFG